MTLFTLPAIAALHSQKSLDSPDAQPSGLSSGSVSRSIWDRDHLELTLYALAAPAGPTIPGYPHIALLALMFQFCSRKQRLQRPFRRVPFHRCGHQGIGRPGEFHRVPENCTEIISFRAFTSPASVAFQRRFFPFDTVILPAGIGPLRRSRL